jgi:peptidyl-dipeptidase Dcp
MKRRTFLTSTAALATLHLCRSGRVSFATKAIDDPLLAEWTGKYGGFPRFDLIKPDAFEAAIGKGIELARADITAIATAKAAPTFDNTIAALEDAGRPLVRANALLGVFRSTMADKQVQEIEVKLAPTLAAYDDEVLQNDKLFARVKAVHDKPGKLAGDQQQLLDVVYRNFVRHGAGISDKARLAEINQKLAALYTQFSNNVLADESTQLKDGDTVIKNTRSSVEPFLASSPDRKKREKAWWMWISRGDNNDAHDNKKVIGDILALRAERAKLLGFASHAHWITDNNMAKTPDAAMALMTKVWTAALARAREEIADMQKLADADKIKIAPWDYRFYAEKVRKAKYDLDQDEVKQYLQLDKLREAMFWVAGQLYGFDFKLVGDVPVVMPDVTVYQVTRGGKHVGLWYFDPYERSGKRSGAWMNEYRTQESWKSAVPPIVSNNANFVKAKSGAVLISWDDASTMFHEFGHALHGLCSNVRYPSIAGTNVKRDFVEFPSQLNERWLPTKEVLSKFAVNESGKPIPDELVAKIDKARRFNQGFKTVEALAAAIYDMKIHMLDKAVDPAAFEKQTMKEIGCPDEIVMRHRPTHFGHIFSGDGYSAGYYAYLWADALTADAAEAFAQAGFYDKPTAKKLYDAIMSVGGSIPAEEAFRKFRGRDVDTDALMRDRGFSVSH